MRTDLPPEIQERFFDFHWDRRRLWDEADRVASVELRLEELNDSLELPIWQRHAGQVIYDLSPAEFLREPDRFPAHRDRAASVDLEFPLLMMQNARGQWVVMDGYHRLVRLHWTRAEKVAVKKLSRAVIPRIRIDHRPTEQVPE